MKLKQYFVALSVPERQLFIDDLAKALGKRSPTIRSYINGHRSIQAKDAKKIEQITNGKVTTAELCPSVFGNNLKSDIYPKDAA